MGSEMCIRDRPHAARYRASQAAKERAGRGAGGHRDWRQRDANGNLGGWRDSTQALPKRPPTPPVELWDCDIEELEAAKVAKSDTPPTPASTPTTDAEEEEAGEENWDTASEEELSWDDLQTETPPTDYSNVPSPEEAVSYTHLTLPTTPYV